MNFQIIMGGWAIMWGEPDKFNLHRGPKGDIDEVVFGEVPSYWETWERVAGPIYKRVKKGDTE